MPDDAPFDGPWEVLIETYGYEPQHVRGDLLMRGDVPYDLDWAEQTGAVRRAPELADRFSHSTTQPLRPDGTVDEDVQRQAAHDAGFGPDAARDKPPARPQAPPAPASPSPAASKATDESRPATPQNNAPPSQPPAPPEQK